eukprot:s3519_g8.t1
MQGRWVAEIGGDNKLKGYLEEFGLKSDEGPMDENEGSMSFLKRSFRFFQAKKGGMDPLSAEDRHTFRKGVEVLLYLAPERPDIMYVLMKLSTKLASPVEADLELLRYTAK